MNSLFDKKPFWVLDGALGTRLIKAGLEEGRCPEEWILESPEHEATVEAIQREYAEAGSDILYTPTFGANRAALSRYGIEEKEAEYIKRLVAITKRAASGKDVLIAGDISTTGLFMKPTGDVGFSELKAIFAEEAKYLDEAGVDLFAIETQLSLDETRAAVLGVREVSDKPIIATMTLEASGRTMSGNTPEACMLSLWALGVSGFGLNCSSGPKEMKESFARLIEYRPDGLALIAKPNAGLPHCTDDGSTVFDLTGDDFAEAMRELALLGVSVMGGCCGTDAGYISKITDITPVPTAPAKTDRLLCDGRNIYDLGESPTLSEPLECGEGLTDSIFSAEGDIIAISVNNKEALEYLPEAMMYADRPVMFRANNAEALAGALELYVGRAAVSADGISHAELENIIDRFGAVVL